MCSVNTRCVNTIGDGAGTCPQSNKPTTVTFDSNSVFATNSAVTTETIPVIANENSKVFQKGDEITAEPVEEKTAVQITHLFQPGEEIKIDPSKIDP